MNDKVKRPSDVFVEWLTHLVSRAEPGTRLQTHAQLARTWKLSPVTVRKLLTPFQRDGRIVSVPGRGTCVGPVTPVADSLPDQTIRSSAQHIVETLVSMINRGELKRGDALPAVKTICIQHHVTPATVAAAYRLLAASNRAVRVGRRYWVGTLEKAPPVQGAREVHFFCHGAGEIDSFFRRIQYLPALIEMENELQQLSIRLRFDTADSLEHALGVWRQSRDAPAGIVVASDDMRYLTDVTPKLEQFLSGRLLNRPRIMLAGARGERRSRMLLHFTHGHIHTIKARAVAAFAVERRFSGIDIMYGEIRESDATLRDVLRLIAELYALSAAATPRFVVQRGAWSATAADLVRNLRAWWDPDYLLSITGLENRGGFSQLERMIHIVETPEHWYRAGASGALWYFPSDRLASQALAWCRAHAVAVPERAAILCAEDSLLCRSTGVSACSIDWHTIGYLMAHALAGDIKVARTTRGYIRASARITERQTTP